MRYVPQWDVEGVWKEAVSKLDLAIARQTAFDAQGLKQMLLRAEMHLWLSDAAAMVTQIQSYQLERICVLVLCGGDDLKSWNDETWKQLLGYARFFACKAIVVHGREGWSRVRPELEIKDTIMRYEL